MAVDVPLVGRATELELFADRLREPEPPSIVLAGPPGVGKTRLAAEAAGLAAALGYTTEHVMATRAAASIPLGPFAPLLPDAEVASSGLLGLLRTVADTLLDRAGPDRRLLLVVDDAHLLDEASATLIHQLAASARAGLIATVRVPHPAPDPITALWKDGLAERLDIGPLTEPEVADFAAGVLSGPVAGATVRRLWEFSGGNALYLRELLRGLADSGAMTNRDGIWILSRPPEAPARLVELLGSRLDGLPQQVVDVVDYLALAGSLGYELIEQLTSAEAAEAAEQSGLIRVAADDDRRSETRLAHPLYGEVRRQHMPRTRLRRLRRELADCLSASGARRREDLLLIASLQLAAGEAGDPDTLTRAAKRAREMYDLDLAARLATAAIEAGGGVDAGLVLAVTHFSTGAHQAADELLTTLTDQCTTDSERAAIANARAYNRGVLMADPDGALDVVAAARRTIKDPNATAVLAARAAMMRLFAGEPAAALAESQPSMTSDDQVTATRGYFLATTSLALLGRANDALELAARAIELARECGGGTQIPEAQYVGGVLGHEAAGELRPAEALAVAGYQAALEAGDKEGMATFSLLAGKVRVELGQLDAAARAFREGAAINREIKDETALRWCLGGLALAAGIAGDAAAALAATAELDKLGTDWVQIYRPDLVDRGRAWSSIANGESTSGRQLLHDAADRAAAMQMVVAEAHVLNDLARLGEATAVRARLATLAADSDAGLVRLFADHAAAVASGDAAQLDVVAERCAEHGAMTLAADTARAAELAYLDRGHSRQASAASRRAQEYAAAAGLVVPGRAEPTELDRLTAREREIAGLAATGTSSKDISGRLFISQRTVDNHLQRIYTKLGVNSRDQLRDLLAGG